MNLATWKSIKSPIMQEIRLSLKKKANPGEPTPSRAEANRTWREDILGIQSEDQKKAIKLKKQQKATKAKARQYKELEDE